jgi:hypothetical protein
MWNRKNLPLILALGLPVLMIIAIAIAIYLPARNIKPSQNFLYLSGTDLYYSTIGVVDGRVQKMPSPVPPDYYRPPAPASETLYLYDFSTGESKELTMTEAAAYKVNPAPISKEGYEVMQGGYGGGFIFDGPSNYNKVYVRSGSAGKRLNINLGSRSYYNGFRFLGWVEK